MLDNIKMNSYISNNYFESNTASLAGGSIKWSNNLPQIDERNQFNMNTARYGSNIASYPIRLIVNIHKLDNFTTPDNNMSLIANGIENQTIVIENVSSGNDFPYVIVIKTVDLYGNVVQLDNAY